MHVEGEQRLNVELAAIDVTYGARGFSACLSLPVLKGLLASELPRMRFSDVAVSLYDDAQHVTMKPLFVMEDGHEVEVPAVSFPAHLLAPPGGTEVADRRDRIPAHRHVRHDRVAARAVVHRPAADDEVVSRRPARGQSEDGEVPACQPHDRTAE